MTQTGKLLEMAKKMAEAAEKKAVEIDVPMVIAVCDMGGNTVLVHRMEDSLLASISIAQNKAYTAASLKMQGMLQRKPENSLVLVIAVKAEL